MKNISLIINAIERAQSYNDKLSLLDGYRDLEGLQEVLKFIYNPYCKTGISTAKAKKFMNVAVNEEITWKDAIQYFSTHTTGSNDDLMFASKFVSSVKKFHGDNAKYVAIGMVTQDLKIGITATSLNKVYGNDFIPKTGCMLGTLYADIEPSRVKWPCIVTEKLDGVRRILVKDGDVCKFYSRSGHEDTGLVDIVKEAVHLPSGFVYDGELLAKGTFKDSIAQRQATNSLANMKGTKTGLTFNVFDMVPVQDFYKGYCNDTALNRKIRLAATFNDESLQYIDEDWAKRICAFGMYADLHYILVVPILGLAHNLIEVEPIAKEIWERGGEGVMLNTVVGPYEIKRTKDLIKLKRTEEYVLQVVNMLEGNGKYEDSLGALVVDYNGSLVGVGSGFTDEQRTYIWKHPKKFIGRMVEIDSFGASINAQGNISLNCPIFKRFVGDEYGNND